MRPTVSAKHKAMADKIAADVDAYLRSGGQATTFDPTARARPPVDHWQDRISEDYRAAREDGK